MADDNCPCEPGYETGGCVFRPDVCPRKKPTRQAEARWWNTPGLRIVLIGGGCLVACIAILNLAGMPLVGIGMAVGWLMAWVTGLCAEGGRRR